MLLNHILVHYTTLLVFLHPATSLAVNFLSGRCNTMVLMAVHTLEINISITFAERVVTL
jgi:hypothetical protein